MALSVMGVLLVFPLRFDTTILSPDAPQPVTPIPAPPATSKLPREQFSPLTHSGHERCFHIVSVCRDIAESTGRPLRRQRPAPISGAAPSSETSGDQPRLPEPLDLFQRDQQRERNSDSHRQIVSMERTKAE